MVSDESKEAICLSVSLTINKFSVISGSAIQFRSKDDCYDWLLENVSFFPLHKSISCQNNMIMA